MEKCANGGNRTQQPRGIALVLQNERAIFVQRETPLNLQINILTENTSSFIINVKLGMPLYFFVFKIIN